MRRLELVAPWGWGEVDQGTLHEIREKLGNYETMSFKQITQNDGAGCHEINISELCPEAQKRLVALKLDDVDTLFAFRITKAKRVWGFRSGYVISLLWWDPDHKVYPMNVKNN